MFSTGSDSENLYFFERASKYIAAIWLPSIAQPLPFIAPSRIDFLRSGMILFSSIFRNTPSPVHFGHAPNGLLNENILGDRSSILTPWSGQAYFCENTTSSSPKFTMIRPPPSFEAVSMLSARREVISGLITRRSTITSILCFLFFSKGIFSDRSYTIPSARTRTKPDFEAFSSTFTYSPFLPRTTGAITWIFVPCS